MGGPRSKSSEKPLRTSITQFIGYGLFSTVTDLTYSMRLTAWSSAAWRSASCSTGSRTRIARSDFGVRNRNGCVYRKPYPGLSNDRIG
jgi:hypothetical protein